MSGTPVPAPSPIVSQQKPEKNLASEETVEAVLKQYEGLKLANEGEKSFIWPEGMRPDIPHDHYDLELPVIDLSPVLKLQSLRKEVEQLSEGESTMRSHLTEEIEAYEAETSVVAKMIRAACEEYGFFQITNHGFPTEVVDRLRDICLQIFDLPEEEKFKIKSQMVPGKAALPGYTGMKRNGGFAKNNPAHVWNEGLEIESPETLYVGRTEEIANTIWPGKPENSRLLRSSTEEFTKQSRRVIFLLMDLIADSLTIPKDFVQSIVGDQDKSKMRARFRINHYPICTHADKTLGLNGHTDPAVLTLLHQGDVGGLQIHYKDGTWHGVQPVPGAFVVNCGDYLQAWTNGRFLSAEHRVVPNKTSRRLSIAYFALCEMNCVISPRPECVDDEHPVRYRAFTVMEYLQTVMTLGLGQDVGQMLDKAFGLSTPS